jgi:hypothetical protein
MIRLENTLPPAARGEAHGALSIAQIVLFALYPAFYVCPPQKHLIKELL